MPRIVPARSGARIAGAVEIRTEDGRIINCRDALPDDVPCGYHEVAQRSGGTTQLIVTPVRCPLPRRARSVGFAVQLYASRGRASWGMGDLGDLAMLASWAHDLGVALLLLNPLHAASPGLPQNPSPYSPSSRRYRNPLYIAVEQVRGIERVVNVLPSLRAQAERLRAGRRIDRDAVYRLKMAALERLWEVIDDVPELDSFMQGDAGVLRYATFCALVERHGPRWRTWPEDLRRPDATGVPAFQRHHRRRIRFHVWLQWLIEVQLAAAATCCGLVQDLAVGFDPDGADAWEWQDCIVDGVEVGAPPDEFNTLGQRWGLAVLDPERLTQSGYEPFVQTLRASFRHAAGLRIDHAMGMFRLFWIPREAPVERGRYVRYPAQALLDILALEATRADAFVVAEDLGTVEPGVREELSSRDILLTRLLWFESDPRAYPAKSLCGVTTHDLPTVCGLWDGSDLETQRKAALRPNAQAQEAMRGRVAAMVGLGEGAPLEDVVSDVYGQLARAPSLVAAATLEDMALQRERPNLPGSVGAWPNWSLGLPVPLEQLTASPLPGRIARLLGAG